MLVSLGMDPEYPLEVQKDMAALRELRNLLDDQEFQRDMLHLRKWRKSMDSVQSKGLLAIVGMIVAGGIATLWIGFKDLLTGGTH